MVTRKKGMPLMKQLLTVFVLAATLVGPVAAFAAPSSDARPNTQDMAQAYAAPNGDTGRFVQGQHYDGQMASGDNHWHSVPDAHPNSGVSQGNGG